MIHSGAGLAAVCLGAAVLSLLAGCGDGGEQASDRSGTASRAGDSSAPLGDRYIAAADAICRDAQREIGRLGREFGEGAASSGAANPVEATTELLFVPGLRIRERQANRLRQLERSAGDGTALDVYLELFAPIEELIRQRIDAGRAGDDEEASRLEGLISDLGVEQGQDAREIGLRECDYDFTSTVFPGGAP